MFDNLDYNQYAKMRQRGLERQAQQLQQKQAALQAAQNQPKKSTLEQALGGLVTGIGERLNDIGNTAKNVGKTAFGWFNELVSGGQTDNTMKDDSKRRNDIAKKYGFNSYTEAINSDKVGDDFWNEIKGSNAQTKKTLDTQINDYRNSASGKLADVTNINTNEAKGQALNTIDSVLGIIPGALPNVAGGALSGIGDEYKAAGREGRDFNWNQAKNNAIVGAGSGLAGAAGSALAGKAAAKAGGNALGKLLGSNVARGAAGGAAAGATGGALGAALNGGTLEDALLAAKEGAKAGGIGGGAMAGAMGLGGKALERFRNGKNGKATTIDTSEPVDAQIVQKNRIEAPNQRQLASTVEAVEPISTRRGIAITDLDAGEQPVNVRNARQTLKNNTKNPSYYYYPEEQSIKPIEIDANGNYNVTDGINTIKTINGKVGTYNGSGDWKGAKVFDGQDGRGIPEGYKLMANENAAPSNEYVAIVNRSGEKALIKLPQASDYDYERVGLATGTTRESLANSGLIESANDYKPSKPYTKNGRKYIDSVVRRSDANLPEAQLFPTDANDWYRNTLDDNQRSAIMDMQYNTKQINELLSGRGNNIPQDRAAELARKAQTVSDAIGQFRVDSPITVYRGMGADEFANLIFGEPSTESFKSATFDKGTAENFAKNQGGYVAEYRINPGRYGADVSAVPGSSESEFLINKNIPYASVKRDVPNKRAYITIGEPNPNRKISIENALGQTQDVPVENLATNYRKSTIPARQYNEQAKTASRGKYIDGIVRGENLPEAELPKPLTVEQRYQIGMGDANILDSVSRGQFSDEFGYQNLMDNLPKELQERVKAATADGALVNNPYAGFNTKYEIRKQSDLPTLDRQQYYNDVTGNLKRGGGVLTSEDIPEYMQSHLRDGGGRNNDVLLNELFGDDMDLRDQYEQYQQMAQVRQPKTYTTENMAYGLNMDSNLANDITEYLANEYGPKAKEPTKINIEKALAQTQDVPVESLATNYRKSTIPARQYEQAIRNMPEAEIATRPTTAAMEAPEQRVATQERQVAANMSPADQARLERNITVLEQKQGNELLKQYGVLDRPTRRIVEDAPKVLANLQDSMGLTTPEEVQYAANHVTGGDGILAKATNQLASTATVDTRFEPNFIESLIEINGLNEADAKAVSKQIKGALNKLGERRKYVNGSDVLDTVKQLQGIARDYKGTSGTYHNATNADKFKVHVIEGVAQELEDRLWNAASPNIKQVITPELLDSMKQMYPGNATWQNFVDNTVANARNGKELRAIQKPLVMGGYIVKGSKMSAGSFGETVANGAIQAGGAKGAAKNAAKVVADKVFNSPKQQQKRATKYQQQKQVAESQLRGETPVTANTSKLGAAKEKIANAGIVQGAKNLVGKAGNALAGATESLNNDSLAGINGIRVGKNYTPIEFDALGNQAAKFANKQMGSTTANAAQDRLESARTLANAQADYDNALADYQASEAQTNALTQQMQQSQSQLGRIEQAMQLALNAGDITAYSQLADLYKQAAEIEELKNPTKTASTKALSANQAKALTAQQQLDTLSQMTPDAGTVASNIPILSGIVNLTGGNEYANQASSLATTLGYLLSGANIKESEAQRIGQAYVPTAFDSEAVRKQKLERARQLIQSYMSDTGAIEQ